MNKSYNTFIGGRNIGKDFMLKIEGMCDEAYKHGYTHARHDFELQMINSLMDKTSADEEEIMIYIVLGATQAVKMAFIDMDDRTRERAEAIRDAAKEIYEERKVNK